MQTHDDRSHRAPRSPVLDVVGRGGGRPLDGGVRRQMEGAFEQDFGDVRIHTGPDASRSAASVQASAYTVGSDIVFRDRAYSPGTEDGNRRLAHELAHVVQQREGPVDGTPRAGGIAVSSPSDRFERAARATADRVTAKLAGTAGFAARDGHDRLAPRLARVVQQRGGPVTVQRDEESAKLLTKLATPKIGEGPAISVQKKLIEDLDNLLADETASEINLGGILLDRVPDCYEDSDDLFAKAAREARLVPLPASIAGANRSVGADRGELVLKAGLGPAVVENTLKTMIDAEQLEYLRLAGLPNDKWKILVEVQYIRTRPKDMTGFHKDTKGQTLFVNLNYHVGDNRVMGPEYVLNPTPSPKHEEQIKGTVGKPGTLPKEFTDDIDRTRGPLGEPTEIRTGVVNPYGYVAFVDEAIHHATPYYGHRFVTGKEFKAYLAHKHPAKHAEIVRADQKFQSPWPWYRDSPLSSYVNKKIIRDDEFATWETWRAMTRDDKQDQQYTREHFAATMTADEIDEMIETVGSFEGAARKGAGGFYAASIPGSGLFPVNRRGRPPLKRQASTTDFKRDRPEPLPEDVPRKFLRTWVRAVPEEAAAKLRQAIKEERWTKVGY